MLGTLPGETMPAIKCPVNGCSFTTQKDAGDAAAAAQLKVHVERDHYPPPTKQVALQAPPPQAPPHGYAVQQAQFHGFPPQQQAQFYGFPPQQQAPFYGYASQQVQTHGYGPQQVQMHGYGPQFVQTHAFGVQQAQSYVYPPQGAPAAGYALQIPPAYGDTRQIAAAYGHTHPRPSPPGHPHQRPPHFGAYAPPSASGNFRGCVINNANNIVSQNNYTVINSNIKHFGPTKVQNTHIEKLTVHNTNIENVTVELGVKEDEAETFLGLLGEESARKENLQKLIFLKKENKLQLPTVSKMTRSTCLVRYARPEPHGGTKWGTIWHGTGFITTLPVSGFKGAVLFSAGHNFEQNGELLQDFQNFSFIFNNSPGVVDPLKPTDDVDEKSIITKTMEEFMREFTCTIVINFKGKKLIKKPNEPSILSLHQQKDFDYFALILQDDRAQENLREQSLELLETASEFELKNCTGDPVFIFGHPGLEFCDCCQKKCSCEAANPPCHCNPPCHHPACSCRHPLRFSYGITKKEKIKNSIYYKLDTQGGNSGSPITGKQYTVLGIHVSDTPGEYNRAQSLLAVLKDLADGDGEKGANSDSSDLVLQKIVESLRHKLKLN